jgi:hypothetical protein
MKLVEDRFVVGDKFSAHGSNPRQFEAGFAESTRSGQRLPRGRFQGLMTCRVSSCIAALYTAKPVRQGQSLHTATVSLNLVHPRSQKKIFRVSAEGICYSRSI